MVSNVTIGDHGDLRANLMPQLPGKLHVKIGKMFASKPKVFNKLSKYYLKLLKLKTKLQCRY